MLLQRGDNPKMGGGLPLSYYFTVQLHLLYVGRKGKVSFITF